MSHFLKKLAFIILPGVLLLFLVACQAGESTPPPAEFSGRMLFYGSTGILEVTSGGVSTFHAWPEAGVQRVIASPNGAYVLIAYRSKCALLSTLTWQSAALDFDHVYGSEIFSPDGRWLARPEASQVVLYDTATAQKKALFSPKCHKYSPAPNLAGGEWCLRVEGVYWLSADQLLVTHAAGLFDNSFQFPDTITVAADQGVAVFGKIDTASVLNLDGSFVGQFAFEKMILWVEEGRIFTNGATYEDYQSYAVADLLAGVSVPEGYTPAVFVPAPVGKYGSQYAVKDGQYIYKESGAAVTLTPEPDFNLGCQRLDESSPRACLLKTHTDPASATLALYPQDGEIQFFTVTIPESDSFPRWVAWVAGGE